MRVDRYEVLGEVARGGMGVVYKARDPTLERVVALKVVLASLDPQARARFVTEAQAAARLDHENVVRVHAAGASPDGRAWLVMDWVEGESLRARLRRGPLPQAEAARVLLGVARAIAHAHERGVVHRDVKPENVLVDEEGRPRLADFGVARVVGGATRLTRTGELVGTPAYMSPEQAVGDPSRIGPAADVWALGVLLHELLTGAPPFRASSVVGLLDQIVRTPAPAPSSIAPGIDPRLDALVLRCLEKEPGRRGSAQEVVAALEEAPGRRGRRSTLIAGAAGALLLALAAGLGAALVREPVDRPADPAGRATSIDTRGATAPERSWIRVLRPGPGLSTWDDEVDIEVVAAPPDVPAGQALRLRVGQREHEVLAGRPTTVRADLDLGPRTLTLELVRDGRAWGTPLRLPIERRPAPRRLLDAPPARRPPRAVDGLEPATDVADPLGLASTHVAYRNPGTPGRRGDDAIFVWIPPGSATVKGEAEERRLERGVFLGATEVSRAQLAAFRAAARHDAQDAPMPAHDDAPATEVDWYEAQAYCRWAGGRLPTSKEWQRAATGDAGRRYPWGDDAPPPGAVNVLGSLAGGPALRIPFEHMSDLGPFGCLGLGGNAAEWVADRPSSVEGPLEAGSPRVIRGGSANEQLEMALNFMRRQLPASADDEPAELRELRLFTGFRVAIDDEGRTRLAPRLLSWRVSACLFEPTLTDPPAPDGEPEALLRRAGSAPRIDDARVEGLDLRMGDLSLGHALRRDGDAREPLDPRFPADHVVVVATSRPHLPAGRWLVVARADDGVRVWVDGARVIDDWRRHLMRLSVHAFETTAPRVVELRVEYFELSGEATLAVDVVPDGP